MNYAKKRFGQHFLTDPAVIQKIINAAQPKAEDHFLEIGPGRGILTGPLLEKINRLDCLEIDKDLIPILKKQFLTFENKINLINIDALKFDLNNLNVNNHSLRIIGNLPYNISTPLLFHLLKYLHLIKDMHFMLQKEVVDRIVAEPNNKNFGRLTLMIQYFCETNALFDVKPNAFNPPPKVDSAFIRLIPHKKNPYPVSNFELFEKLVLLGFNQRRKMISNTFKSYLNMEEFEKLNLDPKARPENLSLEEWTKLSNYIDLKDL